MSDASLRVFVQGPLAVHVDGFADELSALGYSQATIRDYLRLIAHLSCWLVSAGLEVGDLTAERMDAFLRMRYPSGHIRRGAPRALGRLLDYLHRIGVVPIPKAPAVAGPMETLRGEYHSYLVRERGLVATTVHRYEAVAREFLTWAMDNGSRLDALTTGDVTQFVLDRCRRQSVGSAKNLVTELRSLLRFLYLEGRIATQLASAVPALPGWRDRSLPRGIDRQWIVQLLDSCARDTPAGCRDYAILTLLVRLGLRAGEVAALELCDVNWRHGTIMIRGKGNRQERLPLPVDVGEALS